MTRIEAWTRYVIEASRTDDARAAALALASAREADVLGAGVDREYTLRHAGWLRLDLEGVAAGLDALVRGGDVLKDERGHFWPLDRIGEPIK